MIAGWIATTVDDFWAVVGDPSPLPRDLRDVVSLGHPITCLELPNLDVMSVERWLTAREAPYRMFCRNRSLHGCVVATEGQALIFVSADDAPEEQRFTVAHEIAHVLLDYLEPRERALTKLGPVILPVLNGVRPPTVNERIDSVLAEVPLGVYVDLMKRTEGSDIEQGFILRAEERANILALELLAPMEAVRAELRVAHECHPFERLKSLVRILNKQFGLPRRVATGYATWLARPDLPLSTADWLGIRR